MLSKSILLFERSMGIFAYRLNGIGVKNDAFACHHLGDFFNGKYRARLVIRIHNRHDSGVLGKLFF